MSKKNSPPQKLHIRTLYSLGVILLAGLMSACAGSGAKAPSDSLRIFLRPDSSDLAPGAPLVVEVFLCNTGAKPLKITALNHKTVSFWSRGIAQEAVARVTPVYSEKEETFASLELEGDSLVSRRFLFHRATLTTGTWTLVATYDSDPSEISTQRYFATSRPMEYRVAGDWALRRDRNGVLLKSEAIRLALEAIEEAADSAEAKLIVNEAGFLDWFVLLHFKEKGVKRAFLVSPYWGQVRKEVDPALFPQVREAPTAPPPIYRP